ncbi:MAG TPA: HAMP domain-containing sensor histidine kinase [Candidatus Krumholzibacterium sp.]|nr:HAMP domain-containing sensor histidine kinase [Candidatus Krumholzibacterium sp.]
MLVGAALAGLIIVQVAYLERAHERELRVFSRNVEGALSGIVRKIETREVWMMVSSLVLDGDGRQGQRTVTLNIDRDEFDDARRKIFSISDSTLVPGGIISRLCDTDSAGRENDIISILRIDSTAGDTTAWSRSSHDSIIVHHAGPPDSMLGRRFIVEKVLEDMNGIGGAGALERIDAALLDSVVAVTLDEAGIRTGCAYGITTPGGDSLLLAVPATYGNDLLESGYRTKLFPNDMPPRSEELVLYFPDRSSYLFGQERAFLVLALFSIFLLGGCFIYVIRTLMIQKRFSLRLVDFINNMTHEFKTPVSTIAIVGENLGGLKGGIEPDRIENYSRILAQESGRMRHQVEKILEMAALEEGRIALSRDTIDLGELLEKAAEGLKMRLGPAGGSIEISRTDDVTIEGDRTHLENVFHNLLDNAIKYSPDSPRIAVSMILEDGFVAVSVTDGGIGIKAEDLRHVFEKYYRVGTGDRHDVKGFGLGLSYVRLIVEAHGGSVSATSRPGMGSTFTVRIPRRPRAGEAPRR